MQVPSLLLMALGTRLLPRFSCPSPSPTPSSCWPSCSLLSKQGMHPLHPLPLPHPPPSPSTLPWLLLHPLPLPRPSPSHGRCRRHSVLLPPPLPPPLAQLLAPLPPLLALLPPPLLHRLLLLSLSLHTLHAPTQPGSCPHRPISTQTSFNTFAYVALGCGSRC